MRTSLFAIALPRDTAVVLLSALLIPRWGAMGMAAACAVGAAIAMVSELILVRLWGLRSTVIA